MANVLIDNTFYVDTPGAVALSWPTGARVSQVRIFGVDTTAAAIFVVAGTPILRWGFVTQGAVSVGSATAVVDALTVIPMGNVRFPTAWAPSTLTACTAWIDFS
jgi:hypothetical protein